MERREEHECGEMEQGVLPARQAPFSAKRTLTDEFQWFLIELSVRPGRSFAISLHFADIFFVNQISSLSGECILLSI